MSSNASNELVARSKALYVERWRTELELQHHGAYIAIEPDSQRYFMADNYGDAIRTARKANPERLVFVMRVGYPAAIDLSHHIIVLDKFNPGEHMTNS